MKRSDTTRMRMDGRLNGRSDGRGVRPHTHTHRYTKSTRQIHVHIPTSHHHKYGESECEMDIYICHFCVREIFFAVYTLLSFHLPFASLLICTLVCCFIVYNTYTHLNRNTIVFSVAYSMVWSVVRTIGVSGDSKNHSTNLETYI